MWWNFNHPNGGVKKKHNTLHYPDDKLSAVEELKYISYLIKMVD